MPPSDHVLDFPKIDLYRRLGGTFDAEALAGLGTRTPAPEPTPGSVSNVTDWDAWQLKMQSLEAGLTDQGSFAAAVRSLAGQADRAGIRHIEIAVEVESLNSGGRADEEAILAVLRRAVEDFNYPASPSLGWLILTSLSAPAATVAEALALAAAGRGMGVLGLAVRLSPHDSADCDRVVAGAQGLKVPVVVELDPAVAVGSVTSRLEVLAPRRIVFGRGLLIDLGALAWIREHRPGMVVCPAADRALGLGDDLAGPQLQAMIQAGMQVSLGTWAPSLLGSDLEGDLQRLLTQGQLSDESLFGLMLAGVQASFLGSREKRELEREFEAAIFGFPSG
jgi:aminodeoxyfutalosine deaminase